MNLKNQNLLAIYLNEFNFDYLFSGAKKYKCNSILKILKLKKISTYTKDKELDYDLDPWVQSVSITTGKSSKEHKTFKLGERIEKNVNQIWDILVKNKISCAVWGSMNSRLKKNKYLNYYFPDPWNFKDKTWPKNLIGLYFLPNYYAKNYLKFSYIKFIYHSIQFIVTMILNSKFSNLLSDLSFLIRIVFKKGVNNFILYFMYDLIQLNIFNFHDQKKNHHFLLFFLIQLLTINIIIGMKKIMKNIFLFLQKNYAQKFFY